jgi:hypothetical protein
VCNPLTRPLPLARERSMKRLLTVRSMLYWLPHDLTV